MKYKKNKCEMKEKRIRGNQAILESPNKPLIF